MFPTSPNGCRIWYDWKCDFALTCAGGKLENRAILLNLLFVRTSGSQNGCFDVVLDFANFLAPYGIESSEELWKASENDDSFECFKGLSKIRGGGVVNGKPFWDVFCLRNMIEHSFVPLKNLCHLDSVHQRAHHFTLSNLNNSPSLQVAGTQEKTICW